MFVKQKELIKIGTHSYILPPWHCCMPPDTNRHTTDEHTKQSLASLLFFRGNKAKILPASTLPTILFKSKMPLDFCFLVQVFYCWPQSIQLFSKNLLWFHFQWSSFKNTKFLEWFRSLKIQNIWNAWWSKKKRCILF